MAGSNTEELIRRAHSYNARVTPILLITIFLGSLLHIIGGYDAGVTSGVFTMTPFREKFYPELINSTSKAHSPYCSVANNTINTYTTVFYPLVALGALASAYVSRYFGRLWSARCSAGFTVLGSIVQVFAPTRAAILAGRMLLGLGDGFQEFSAALLLAEISGPNIRGRAVSGIIWFGGFGVLVGQLVAYGSRNREDGWRVSLGMICVPCAVLLLGSLIMPESPTFLCSVGKKERARNSLQRLRGCKDVEAELEDIDVASRYTPTLTRSVRLLLANKEYWPPTLITVAAVTLNWWTGNTAATFYSSTIFTILGFGKRTALLNAVVVGCAKIAGVFIGIALMDRLKRRTILIAGGVGMFVAQVVCAVLFAVYLEDEPGATMTRGQGVGVLVIISTIELIFMSSLNVGLTTVASEVLPLEIRPVGWIIFVVLTATWGAVSTYTFLLQLCAFKWGTYLFFAMISLSAALVGYIIPETQGVPLERLRDVFYDSKLWRRFMPEDRNAWRAKLAYAVGATDYVADSDDDALRRADSGDDEAKALDADDADLTKRSGSDEAAGVGDVQLDAVVHRGDVQLGAVAHRGDAADAEGAYARPARPARGADGLQPTTVSQIGRISTTQSAALRGFGAP